MEWGNWDEETKHREGYFHFCPGVAAGDSEWSVPECSLFLLRILSSHAHHHYVCGKILVWLSHQMPLFCFTWTVFKYNKTKSCWASFWDKVPWIYDKFLLSWSILLFTSQVGEREKTMKGSGAEVRAGRGHSPNTIIGKTDSTWGNKFNLLPIKSE